MHIDKIKINNFKNYISCEVNFSEKINFLYGKNGAGKTNLLDAIHYLSFGKSAINKFDNDNINHKNNFFSLEGCFSNNMIYRCTYEKPNSKKIFENNKKYNQIKKHIGKIPVVFLSPYDINLIRNYSTERRKFFDQILSQTSYKYLENLLSYNRLLKQRNAYLKRISNIEMIERDIIKSYDDKMINLNKSIQDYRLKEIENFTKIFNKNSLKINDEDLKYRIEYFSNFSSNMDTSIYDQNFEKDFFTKKTNVGIHNDDYLFKMDKNLIKRSGSQGQQKTFIISLKLSEFEILKNNLNIKPILLLDDVFHKLDDNKINTLIEYLLDKKFSQIILSDSIDERLSLIKNKLIEPNVIRINKGEVDER